MKELFYFIAVLYLMKNIINLMTIDKYVNRLKKFKELTLNNKEWVNDWDDMSKDMKRHIVSVLINIGFIMWIFIGLLTSNWVLFLTIIIYMFLIYSPLCKMAYGRSILKPLVIVNKSIHIIWALFLIINAFHLKINLFEVIFNLF